MKKRTSEGLLLLLLPLCRQYAYMRSCKAGGGFAKEIGTKSHIILVTILSHVSNFCYIFRYFSWRILPPSQRHACARVKFSGFLFPGEGGEGKKLFIIFRARAMPPSSSLFFRPRCYAFVKGRRRRRICQFGDEEGGRE